jgi:hypothetical protein
MKKMGKVEFFGFNFQKIDITLSAQIEFYEILVD